MGLRDAFTGGPLNGLMTARLSRRAMLVRAGALGAGALLAAPLLAACGGDDDDDATATTGGGTTPTTGSGGEATATTGTGGEATATTGTGGEATATTGTGGAATSTTATGGEATATPAGPEATPTEDKGEPQEGGTWTLTLLQEPDTLDAHKQGSYVSGVIYRYIGDCLVEKDPDLNEVAPALAESYEVSDDGLSYTFHLQEGVMFWDGTPVDATVVKACYDRALNPDTKSAVTIGQLGPVDTITVVDASTVEIKHKNAYSVFLDNIAHPVCSIIDATAADADPDAFGRAPNATGPWKITDWQAASEMTLERNADYNWAPSFAHKGPAYIDKIVVKFFPEQATATVALEAGEVDQIEIAYPDVERFKSDDNYVTIDFYRPSATFMEFQVTKAPFDDVHLRKAFNYVVDRQAVIDAALEGYGRELYGTLPQSIWGWWDGVVDYAYKTDPDKAKEEFSAAGYELDGDQLKKDGQQLSFVFTTIAGQDPQVRGAQVLQAQFKDAGVDMQIEVVDFSTVITRVKAGDYAVSYIGYSYASPDIVYIWFHSDNIGEGLNLSHYSNPELDALIEDSRSSINNDKRLQDYEDIQKLVIDNAIWVPLYEAQTTYGLTKRLAGYKIHPDGHLHLQDAWITD